MGDTGRRSGTILVAFGGVREKRKRAAKSQRSRRFRRFYGGGVVITGELVDAVVDLLTFAEKAGLDFQKVDLDDPTGEVFQVYAAVLAHAGIAAQDVEAAALPILSENSTFPKPKDVLEYCRRAHEARQTEAERIALSMLVRAVDENGYEWKAPPSRVRFGRLLPEGDYSGDGSPAPKAIGPRKPLSDGGKHVLRILRSRDGGGRTPKPRRLRDLGSS